MTITNALRASASEDARSVGLAQKLLDARARTLALVSDLTTYQLLGPKLTIVNPPLWEIGHLGWFQERWCLRRTPDDRLRPSLMQNADVLYDSAAVAHDTRWDLPLPSLDQTLGYMERVLREVLQSLDHDTSTDAAYFAELVAAHEEMHSEAFTYTRQTLAYSAPRVPAGGNLEDSQIVTGDAELAGGEFMLGAAEDRGFVFDNEKWAHPVAVGPFRIARTALTNAEFAEFVDDDGYSRANLWCDEGWKWREGAAAMHPVYWFRRDGEWLERRYDRCEPLARDRPVVHVNWYEAQAYCRWADRRLPTEAEWEYAASFARGQPSKSTYPWGEAPATASRANFFGAHAHTVPVAEYAAGESSAGCRQMMGNVWEWTADMFAAYPGFTRDPYKEYSEPWFGTHKVLRGGSFATRAWLMRNTWRNFYTPDRRDIFAGFRTCA